MFIIFKKSIFDYTKKIKWIFFPYMLIKRTYDRENKINIGMHMVGLDRAGPRAGLRAGPDIMKHKPWPGP